MISFGYVMIYHISKTKLELTKQELRKVYELGRSDSRNSQNEGKYIDTFDYLFDDVMLN